MKFKIIIIPVSITIFLAIAILIIFVFRPISSDKPVVDAVPSREITKSQVMQHTTVNDCWVAIGGSVYRLDSYFVKHPNSTLAAQLCGKIEPEVVLPANLKKTALVAYRIGILAP